MKHKKLLIAVLAGLGLMLTTVGITVAWFSYSKSGTKENTISSGSIKFHYAEGSRTIDVDDMMPMTDAQGKAQNDYFEFTITSDTSRTLDIPYYITARRTASSDANMDSIVKVYLTKVDDNDNETQVLLSKFSSLSQYTNSAINIPNSEKSLYNDTVLAGTTGYSQTYRLRMWIDYDAKYIVQTENEPDQYPLQDKSYALTVNVYGEGNDIGESGKAARENTNITSMTIGTTSATTEDGESYSTTIEVASTDDIPTSMVVETEGNGATVTATKVNTTGALTEDSKIKRLSSSVNVQLPDLTVGTNNYLITVKSVDKTKTKIYNLTVVVELKGPESFATDAWSTIVNAVEAGNTSVYAPKAGGKDNQVLREIRFVDPLTGEETGEKHYLRVANTTSCEDAKLDNPNLTSETACGFVVEFADIISNQYMNNSNQSTGGYPGSDPMFNYVTNTVYNQLPQELKNIIIDTTVVSGHGRTAGETNFITPNQKLYLLSTGEVFPTSSGIVAYNTADGTTRLLDYYELNTNSSDRVKKLGTTTSNLGWWLRSVNNGNDCFGAVSGNYSYYGSRTNAGVSPAFRIGKNRN